MTTGLAPGQTWVVRPTSARHHHRPGLPYTLAVAPGRAADLSGTIGLALLRRTVPGNADPFSVIVRVQEDPSCPADHLLVDQTIRTALGLPSNVEGATARSDLELVPLTMSTADRLRNLWSGVIGRRYLLLRAAPPNPTDIEKQICRIRHDDLVAMGVPEGGRVVLFGFEEVDGRFHLKRRSMQALTLDNEQAAQRAEDEATMAGARWGARYRSPHALLGVDGADLSCIFIDRDGREALGVDRMAPILVRRDTRSALVQEVQDFGIALLASLLALGGVLDPILAARGIGEIGQGAIVLALAFLLAASLAVARLRSDLR